MSIATMLVIALSMLTPQREVCRVGGTQVTINYCGKNAVLEWQSFWDGNPGILWVATLTDFGKDGWMGVCWMYGDTVTPTWFMKVERHGLIISVQYMRIDGGWLPRDFGPDCWCQMKFEVVKRIYPRLGAS